MTYKGATTDHKLMESFTGAMRQSLQSATSADACRTLQDNAQKTVRALFSDIESSASAKTLSGKLFQCMMIDYECLQKIRRADCDTVANAVLTEHLYQTSTEKTLEEFARILKESGMPKQNVLGERIEAVLATAATANATEVPSTVSTDERARALSRTPSVEDESDQEMETDTLEPLNDMAVSR